MSERDNKKILGGVPIPEHPPIGVSNDHTQRIWYTLDDRIKRNVLSVSPSTSRNLDGLTPRDQYILKHQYQGQRNIDNIAGAVRNVALQGLRPMQAIGRHLGVGSDIGGINRIMSSSIPENIIKWIVSQSIIFERENNEIQEFIRYNAGSLEVTNKRGVANNNTIINDTKKGLFETMSRITNLSSREKNIVKELIESSINSNIIERNIPSDDLIAFIRQNGNNLEHELKEFMNTHIKPNLNTESKFNKTVNKYMSLLETNEQNKEENKPEQTNTQNTQQQNQQFGPRVQNPQQSSWQQEQQTSDNLQSGITPTLAAMKQGQLPQTNQEQPEQNQTPETPQYNNLSNAALSMAGAERSFDALKNQDHVKHAESELRKMLGSAGADPKLSIEDLMRKSMPWLMGASIIGGDGQAVGSGDGNIENDEEQEDTPDAGDEAYRQMYNKQQ